MGSGRPEKRGLYNLASTPEALPRFIADKNVELFTKHHIFTKEEIYSRYEILLENYVKTIGIESRTLQEMLTKDFLPAVSSYTGTVARIPLPERHSSPLFPLKKRRNW